MAAFVIVVLAATRTDEIARGTALKIALAYSLLGAAFRLSAYFIARLLQARIPSERTVAEGASIRRFRWIVLAVYFAMLLSVAFVLSTITPSSAALQHERDYAVFLAYMTFILVQAGLGWPWAMLHPKHVHVAAARSQSRMRRHSSIDDTAR